MMIVTYEYDKITGIIDILSIKSLYIDDNTIKWLDESEKKNSVMT